MDVFIDTDYPIEAGSHVKVSYKPSFRPSDRKDHWVYIRTPQSDLFNLAEPVSEMMVVYLAGFITPLFGWRTLMIREEFPDAFFKHIKTGEQIRVEFESLSSHFLDHDHPPSGCDAIICWQDNMARADKARYLFAKNPDLKIIELRKIFHHYDFVVEFEAES
jgi:hypothetical protein